VCAKFLLCCALNPFSLLFDTSDNVNKKDNDDDILCMYIARLDLPMLNRFISIPFSNSLNTQTTG
jgi:hypothetical protein